VSARQNGATGFIKPALIRCDNSICSVYPRNPVDFMETAEICAPSGQSYAHDFPSGEVKEKEGIRGQKNGVIP